MAQNTCQTATFIQVTDSCELTTYYQSGYDDRWFTFSPETPGVGFEIEWDYSPRWAYIPYDTLYIYTGSCDSLVEYAILSPIPTEGEGYFDGSMDVFFRYTRVQSTPTDIEFDLCVFKKSSKYFCIDITENDTANNWNDTLFTCCADNYFLLPLEMLPDTIGIWDGMSQQYFISANNCFFEFCYNEYEELLYSATLSGSGSSGPEVTHTHMNCPPADKYVLWKFQGSFGTYTTTQHYSQLSTPIARNYQNNYGVDVVEAIEFIYIPANCNQTATVKILSWNRIYVTVTPPPEPPFIDVFAVPEPVCPSCMTNEEVCAVTAFPQYYPLQVGYYWENGSCLPFNNTQCCKYNLSNVTLPVTYDLIVSYSNECGNSTIKRPVSISYSPGFVTNGNCPEMETLFTGFVSCQDETGINLLWSWDFGDGTTGNGQSLTHIYNLPRSYQVILKITDQCGNTESFSQAIQILDLPEIEAGLDINNNCAGNIIHAYVNNADPDYTYTWSVHPSYGIYFLESNDYTATGYSSVTAYISDPLLIQVPTIIYVTATDNNTSCENHTELHVFPCCNLSADHHFNDISFDNVISTFTNKTIIFNGYNQIENHSTIIFEDCYLYFGGESKIDIQNFSNVVFRNCTLTSCSDMVLYMWNGVFVNDSTSGIIMTGSYAENAINTIVSKDNSYFSISDNIFNKNHISLIVSSTDAVSCVFDYNHITSTTLLLPPYQNTKSWKGIDAENSSNLTIGPGNLFFDMNNAICLHNTGAQIFDNEMTLSTLVSVSYPATKIIDIIGEKQFSIPLHPLKTITISNNVFHTANYGVFSKYCLNLNILENNVFDDLSRAILYQDMYLGEVNIKNNHFSSPSVCIHSLNNGFLHQSNILNNNIHLGAGKPSGTGIVIAETNVYSGAKYLIEGNSIHINRYTGRGIMLNNTLNADVRFNTIIVSNNSGSVLPSIGIQLNNCYYTNIYANEISATGNYFNTYSTGIRLSQSPGTEGVCNQITRMGYGISTYGSSAQSYVERNQFRQLRFGITSHINGAYGTQGSDIPYAPSDNSWRQVANHTWAFQSLGDTLFVGNRTQAQVTWNPVIDYSHCTPSNDPTVATAFSRVILPNISWPAACPSQQVAPKNPVSLYKQMAKGHIDFSVYPIESRAWGKNQLLKIIPADSLAWTDGELRHYYDSIRFETPGLLDSVDVLMAMADYSSALMVQSIISPADSIELNKHQTQTMLLHYFQNGHELNQYEIDQMRDIAMDCPFTHGEAVYIARAMMTYYDADFIYYIHPCEFSYMEGKGLEYDDDHESNTVVSCFVFPNPTAGIINFEFSTPVECGFIELYNINGQIVSVFEFSSKSSQLQIDVSHCKSGVYMYKVITGNHFYSGKVSVIKN